MAELKRALHLLRRHVTSIEPATVTTDDAATMVELYAAIEHQAAAGKLLFASRAAEGTRWAKGGHRNPAEWLARVNGGSVGEAIGQLDTALRLDALPATADAVRRGEISPSQTKEIASAAAANPTAEAKLLSSAARDSFRQLKHHARRARAAAASQRSLAEREERIRRGRYVRSWSDEEGAVRIDARLTADSGALVLSALDSEATGLFEAARDAGIQEPSAAYLADALVNLVTRQGPETGSSRPPATVHLRIDLAALRRGSLEGGEVCEIPGVGPVSIATAHNMVGDSILKAFVTDGVDVHSVVHIGRSIPAHVRSALEERDPTCVAPGCGIAQGLEIDHWQTPFAESGPSELWNLARLCTFHHRLKTHGGHELLGGPGRWEFRKATPKTADADGRAMLNGDGRVTPEGTKLATRNRRRRAPPRASAD